MRSPWLRKNDSISSRATVETRRSLRGVSASAGLLKGDRSALDGRCQDPTASHRRTASGESSTAWSIGRAMPRGASAPCSHARNVLGLAAGVWLRYNPQLGPESPSCWQRSNGHGRERASVAL